MRREITSTINTTMPSPNNPKKTKCNKVRYETKDEAEIGLGMVQALNMGKGQSDKDKGLHTYKCPYCGKFHVGHKRLKQNAPFV